MGEYRFWCYRWLCYCCIVSLVGCGFQLRGSAALSPKLDRVYLLTNGSSSYLRKLEQSLSLSGVDLVNQALEASYTLRLAKERLDRRDITVTDKARAFEFELLSEVEMTLSDPQGNTVLEPIIIRSERVYELDRNNLIGSREQETLIREEMEDDIIRQILQRLSQIP